MNKEKFQNIKLDRVEETYKKYLDKKSDETTPKNKTQSHDQIKECFCQLPEDPEDKIVRGVMLMFMGINQMIVNERGGSITETRSKTR
jgi:hypothetical protein